MENLMTEFYSTSGTKIFSLELKIVEDGTAVRKLPNVFLSEIFLIFVLFCFVIWQFVSL